MKCCVLGCIVAVKHTVFSGVFHYVIIQFLVWTFEYWRGYERMKCEWNDKNKDEHCIAGVYL